MSLKIKVHGKEGRYYSEDPNDTGLRFTDVLFGFALREAVTRLVAWSDLTTVARVHLVLAVLVILGSYIGFRNSQKRGKYQLRFFNLALVRFATDQTMVFLYFWLALYFQVSALPSGTAIFRFDARIVLTIFGLYLAWDLVSHLMAGSKRYYTVKGSKPEEDEVMKVDTYRTVITIIGLIVAAGIWAIAEFVEPAGGAATWGIAGLALLVVVYRFFKDSLVKT
jgi:hypothetical protein